MKITFLVGDATQPIGDGHKFICHISNDLGLWRRGFVLALSQKWNAPEMFYRNNRDYELGNVQYIRVENDITVVNMIAQHGIGYDEFNSPPIRYWALESCLYDVNKYAQQYNITATIHMPRIGCGLAGGDWAKVEEILHKVLTVDVFVYDLKK